MAKCCRAQSARMVKWCLVVATYCRSIEVARQRDFVVVVVVVGVWISVRFCSESKIVAMCGRGYAGYVAHCAALALVVTARPAGSGLMFEIGM